MSAYANVPRGTARRYRLSEHGPGFQLSHNFVLVEFACPWDGVSPSFTLPDGRVVCDVVIVHPTLVFLLQAARDFFGLALHISEGGGYRTDTYNDLVDGSADDSYHEEGMAADVSMPGVSRQELASFFRDVMESGGTGLYPGHVHVSIGMEGGADRSFGERFANAFPGGIPGFSPALPPPSSTGIDAARPHVAGLSLVGVLLVGGWLWQRLTHA
jgi:hypothetical protein